MKIDSIGAGSQNNMSVDALKTQQNQVQQNDQTAQKATMQKPFQDTVSISPEAAAKASEAQKGGQ